MDLNELSGPWFSILQDVKNGKRVEKQEIIDLLRSGEPVPRECQDLLADALSGKLLFRRGAKPHWATKAALSLLFIMEDVAHLESLITNGFSDEDEPSPEAQEWLIKLQKEARLLGGGSPRGVARNEVSSWYGLGIEAVEKQIREVKRSKTIND